MKKLTKENIQALRMIVNNGYDCINLKVTCHPETKSKGYFICPLKGMCSIYTREQAIKDMLATIKNNSEDYFEVLL